MGFLFTDCERRMRKREGMWGVRRGNTWVVYNKIKSCHVSFAGFYSKQVVNMLRKGQCDNNSFEACFTRK